MAKEVSRIEEIRAQRHLGEGSAHIPGSPPLSRVTADGTRMPRQKGDGDRGEREVTRGCVVARAKAE